MQLANHQAQGATAESHLKHELVIVLSSQLLPPKHDVGIVLEELQHVVESDGTLVSVRHVQFNSQFELAPASFGYLVRRLG